MTRKFLTPIVLPADPAAAMEATTKQYADGLVVINASDPIGSTPQAELWFDSDAPGPVTAGVGLPSSGTTGQRLRKKSNTDYDTEWVDPPAIYYVNSAGGTVAASAATAVATLDVPAMTAGRLYQVTYALRVSQATAAVFDIQWIAPSETHTHQQGAGVSASGATFSFMRTWTANGSIQQFRIIINNWGTQTVTYYNVTGITAVAV